jgi:hypothetical protein
MSTCYFIHGTLIHTYKICVKLYLVGSAPYFVFNCRHKNKIILRRIVFEHKLTRSKKLLRNLRNSEASMFVHY